VLFIVRKGEVHVLHIRHAAREEIPPEELNLDQPDVED